MGRKIDLSGLTDNEAEHVLQVVQRDMKLRKKEEERLSELKQELDEEGSRCLLLSRQSCFNQRCCIRCCSPFIFLLNPKRSCSDCRYNVCKACRVYSKRDKAWLCSACQKSRLLKTQSLEWFYTNVKTRFKRFGSAKVLKTLYRKHLNELNEGSAYEDSICNEGSVCGSDSTFYRQTEEHSMAETLSVALRVAEEAIDEAISQAEFHTDSQEKQNEALYLREHRRELVKELAKTIVEKIISRRNTLSEYVLDCPLDHSTDLHCLHHHHSASEELSSALRKQSGLWRSQSLSLLDDDPPALFQDSAQALQKGGAGSAMSTWKSVDRLDNAVLKSPDGNWIALQSAQLSRPRLLTKRTSLVFSALEKESGVVSAYEGMGSDTENKPEPEADCPWGAALHDFHRKMTNSNFNRRDSADGSPTPPLGGSRDDLTSDSEGNWWQSKPLLAMLKKKVPTEIRLPSSRRTSIIEVNFHLEEEEEEGREKEEQEQEKTPEEPEVGKVQNSQRKLKSREKSATPELDYSEKETHHSEAVTPDTLTSGGTTPEPRDGHEDVEEKALQWLSERVYKSSNREEEEEEVNGVRDGGEETRDVDEEDERQWRMDTDQDEGQTEDEEVDNEEVRRRLYRLVAQSRLTYFSSTDDELDNVGRSEGEWDGEKDEDEDEEEEEKEEEVEGRKQLKEEKTDGLSYKLCQLEKEVGANQFSSTEDELDRAGVVDEEEEEEGRHEELAVKVCRLASQVNATQFSSTEDELDRAGRGEEAEEEEAGEEEEETMDEETLWKLQAEKAVQAAQRRDLAGSLVGASPAFQAAEEVRVERRVQVEGRKRERWESLGDLDVKMFDLRDEIEGREKQSRKDVSEDQTRVREEVEGRRTGGEGTMESKEAEERATESEITPVREVKVLPDVEKWTREQGHELRGSQERWPAAADSDEEDAEFNRIISSMLMMTLEDMGQAAPSQEAETQDSVKTGREAEDGGVGAESKRQTNESQSGGDVSREEDGEDDTGGNKHEQQERGEPVTPEAGQMSKIGEREERGGEAAAEEAEGGCHSDERGEESGGEQSCTASLHEGLLSPQEIQMIEWQRDEDKKGNGSDMELYRTLQFISALLEQVRPGSEALCERHLARMQRYSAVSLRSITTEVLKVLNATEELLLQGVEGGGGDARGCSSTSSLPPNTDPKKLDQQFSRLEENVYVAAGAVYSLEAELSDLEECARSICSGTSDMELSFLEEQVASAAAKVQQSELQIGDISTRIAALKSAGLDVDTQRATKTIPVMPVTLDSSRQMRRRLPAPPVKEDKET